MYRATCLFCREEFDESDRLYDHIKILCWAVIHERRYPEEWTKALKDYVRRAMDPVNGEPGWSNEDIVKELKSMIETNSVVAATARWDTLELLQRIDPEKLPYVRRGGPRPSRDLYVKTERSATLESEAPKTYPEVFYAPSSTPKSLFKHQDRAFFVAHRDFCELLVFTDGACSHNGQKGAQGGCAFVFRCGDGNPRPWNPPKGAYIMHGAFFFRLEDVGPTGKPERPTSNRAELRAVVAALAYFRTETTETGLKFWEPRDSAKLVIATDSTYVVDGATKWCKSWEMNGWKKSDGAPVMNRDLWELLLERIRLLQSTRCQKISFWLVPREQNEVADRIAKYAATLGPRPRFGIPTPGNLPVLVDPSQR